MTCRELRGWQSAHCVPDSVDSPRKSAEHKQQQESFGPEQRNHLQSAQQCWCLADIPTPESVHVAWAPWVKPIDILVETPWNSAEIICGQVPWPQEADSGHRAGTSRAQAVGGVRPESPASCCGWTLVNAMEMPCLLAMLLLQWEARNYWKPHSKACHLL